MRRIICSLIAIAWLPGATAATADGEIRELLAVKIRTVQHMALNPTLIRAVRRQNAAGMSTEEIEQRDAEWRNEELDSQYKWDLQRNRAGRLLRRHVDASESFNEAFLTDNQGANVAAYPPTSDYFQGDEEKWAASFNDGTGQIFLGPLELDESTGVRAVQVSAPVIDRGRTIGVLVVGVTIDYIENKQGNAN